MEAELQRLRHENEVLRSRLAQVSASRPELQHSAAAVDNCCCPLSVLKARLLHSSVLIIGAGGLGSPAALYLAAAGAGRIGVVDQDVVEVNNLHRQIIHSEARVGKHKAESALAACRQLNSTNKVEVHKEAVTPKNALPLVSQYDVVLDCTDNAPTRYLISDACVVAGKPLVSGAAIGTDGQLTVYNYGEDGPCYRCLFPVAPRPESCSRCSDVGVLGVIPGIIGSLQALEAIKIMSMVGQVASRKLVIFDGLAMRFHTVKLRARMKDCIACGPDATVTAESLPSYSYTDFTGQEADDSGPPQLDLLPADQRITPQELLGSLQAGSCKPLIIDVRPQREFELAHLAGSANYPFEETPVRLPHLVKQCKQHTLDVQSQNSSSKQPDTPMRAGDHGTSNSNSGVASDGQHVVVVCRRGNDSQHIVQSLRQQGIQSAVDLIGGLSAWAQHADQSFPNY
ncbi:TPA: Adenylyltransferase and sulfurtransferase MOCS3 [Trebouxia sp. C0005]